MNGQIHAPAALHPGKPAGTLVPQNRSERFGEQNKSCAWTNSNPGLSCPQFMLRSYRSFALFSKICKILRDLRLWQRCCLGIEVFWDVTPCRKVNIYRRFESTYAIMLRMKNSKRSSSVGLTDPEEKGNVALLNVGNYLPFETSVII